MVNQFNYIRNRTPFLDIDFLRTIFRSRLAGIHSGLFDHNPFRRFKGQVLYAHIIKIHGRLSGGYRRTRVMPLKI